MEKVTVIIPAYNEAENIGRVLSAVLKAKSEGIVHDIVVVNDGSTDATGKIARAAGANVIDIPKNKGKGNAFLRGVKYCRSNKTDLLVMLDADLLNLTPDHIKEMLEKLKTPVIKIVNGKKMMTKYAMVVAAVHGPDFLTIRSGQRAIKFKTLQFLFLGAHGPFTSVPAKRFVSMCQGYGLETALNRLFGVSAYGLGRCLFFDTKKKLMAMVPYRKDKAPQDRDIMMTHNMITSRKDAFERAKRSLAVRRRTRHLPK